MGDSLQSGLGNWVDGDRFFNRQREIELFTRYLSEGQSISLVAQRRIGKTSLMRESARRLGANVISVHVDLEKAQTPEDAIVELGLGMRPHEGLWRRAVGIIQGAARGAGELLDNVKLYEITVSLRSGITEKDWKQKGDAIFADLAQVSQQQQKLVILFLDEVPILVSRILKPGGDVITPEGRAQADLFMSWLRDNVLRHRGNVAVVVTGSVGLEPLLGQANLSGTLNVYRSFEIKPWNEPTAIKCLLALATHHRLPLDDIVAKHMIALLGSAIPHHVQMFFDHVYNLYVIEEQAGQVDIQFVDRVYGESMTGLRGHPELSHMEERLKIALTSAQFSIALEILTEAAVAKKISADIATTICAKVCQGDAARQMMNTIIAILIHDGYLHEEQGKFVFNSNLLRDWWSRRFGQGYKLIGDENA